MINYIQANHKQFATSTSYTHITADVWESIINKLQNDDAKDIIPYFNEISVKYNVEGVDLLQDFINYLIKTKPYVLMPKWISVFKFIIHSEVTNVDYLIPYAIYNLKELYKLL